MKTLDKVIKYILLGILFFIPLYFNIFTFSSFEIDKIVLFRILVEISFFLFLIKLVFFGSSIKVSKSFYLSLFLIFFSQVLATLMSEHPAVSFWGSYWRGFGLFTHLHLFIYAFLFFNFFQKEDLKKIFAVISLSGLVASLYALIQTAGFDFLKWAEITDGFHSRASSTFGQPTFLSSYLLLVLPLSLFLAIRQKQFIYKLAWSIALIIQFLALVSTYSRAAWVAMAVTSFLFFVVYLKKKQRILFKLLLAVGAISLFSIIYINLFLNVRTEVDELLNPANRLKTFLNLKQGSGGIRILYYKSALNLIWQSPVFGYGLDNQHYYFSGYYNPSWAIYERINQYTDRSHNETLDMVLTTGILGLGAWLYCLIVIALQTKNALKISGDDGFIIKVLLFGIVASYISVQFSFLTVVTSIFFWSISAALFLFSKNNQQFHVHFNLKKGIAISLASTVGISIIYLIWFYNINISLSDHYFRKAKESEMKGDFDSAVNYFHKILNSNSRESFYYGQFAALRPMNLQVNKLEKLKYLQYLNIILKENERDLNLEGQINSAQVLSEISRLKFENKEGGTHEFEAANASFERLAKNNSGISLIYDHWGDLFFYRNDYDQALQKYEQALSLLPNLNHPDLNIDHKNLVAIETVKCYKKIIAIYIAKKDYLKAEITAKQAIKALPFDLELHDQLNLIYFKQNNINNLRASLAHLSNLYPLNDEILYQLALIYKNNKENHKAKELINKAIGIADKFKYQEFLSSL